MSNADGLHDAYEDMAANSGWTACAGCGEWDDTQNMVEIDGQWYHPSSKCHPEWVTYEDRERIIKDVREHFRLPGGHSVTECIQGITFQIHRTDVYELEQYLLRTYEGIYVFTDRHTFRYAHTSVSFKKKVAIQPLPPPEDYAI